MGKTYSMGIHATHHFDFLSSVWPIKFLTSPIFEFLTSLIFEFQTSLTRAFLVRLNQGSTLKIEKRSNGIETELILSGVSERTSGHEE
jgi:hypothetical protein